MPTCRLVRVLYPYTLPVRAIWYWVPPCFLQTKSDLISPSKSPVNNSSLSSMQNPEKFGSSIGTWENNTSSAQHACWAQRSHYQSQKLQNMSVIMQLSGLIILKCSYLKFPSNKKMYLDVNKHKHIWHHNIHTLNVPATPPVSRVREELDFWNTKQIIWSVPGKVWQQHLYPEYWNMYPVNVNEPRSLTMTTGKK